MSRITSRRSRPLRGRTYSGERRGVLNGFFSDRAFITSQHILHIATRAAHPNRPCSALPRAHRRVDFVHTSGGKYRNSGYLSMDGAQITTVYGGPVAAKSQRGQQRVKGARVELNSPTP